VNLLRSLRQLCYLDTYAANDDVFNTEQPCSAPSVTVTSAANTTVPEPAAPLDPASLLRVDEG